MSQRARRSGNPLPPDDDNAELRAWLRLLGCANLGTSHLRRKLRHEFDLSLPTFDILAQIARPPLGPTMGELSQRLMVSKGSVTDLIERLEGRGLVSRRADPTDGRVQHVHLTAEGQGLLARALPAHKRWIKELMAEMSPQNVAHLFAILGDFKASLRATAARASDMHEAAVRGSRRRRDAANTEDLPVAQRHFGETAP